MAPDSTGPVAHRTKIADAVVTRETLEISDSFVTLGEDSARTVRLPVPTGRHAVWCTWVELRHSDDVEEWLWVQSRNAFFSIDLDGAKPGHAWILLGVWMLSGLPWVVWVWWPGV